MAWEFKGVEALGQNRHSRSLWSDLGLFSINVVSRSRNLVLSGSLFSVNWVRKRAMFLGQAIYVLGPLELPCVRKMFFPKCAPRLSLSEAAPLFTVLWC